MMTMPRYDTNKIDIESQPTLEEKFVKYLSEHSIEQTQGYLEGITELYNFIESLCYVIDKKDDTYCQRGVTQGHTMLEKFLKHNRDSIENCNSKIEDRKNVVVNPDQKSDATLRP